MNLFCLFKNKLWQTINQQCIPEFKNGSLQSPCIKVDQQHRYVIYKDIKGPLHDLLLPLAKISGIESPILQQNYKRVLAHSGKMSPAGMGKVRL
ncbi:CDP-diacylglycerol diphosphatase [Arsenophonus sp.]|uniref:CDP-diacylglycerol diphosphatase n=1 Tax=Arsenophonus sp. TaxID=1872640 RepID=UPI0038D5163E